MVHQPIAFTDGMKIPDAKAAADKEWDKFTSLGLGVQESQTQVRSKKEIPDGPVPSQTPRAGETSPNGQGKSRTPGGQRQS